MTRLLTVTLAVSLIATPLLADGVMVDLPRLTYPQTTATVTQSTSGPMSLATTASRD